MHANVGTGYFGTPDENPVPLNRRSANGSFWRHANAPERSCRCSNNKIPMMHEYAIALQRPNGGLAEKLA